LRQIDSIILVGKTEVNKFKEATGKDNVVYIPHGVFTDFYHPNDSIKKEILLLTVGNWLRDYQFADKVYAQFLDRHPDWRVVVVAKPENTQYIHKDARISCLSGISDEELKSLYQKSTILFLPLIRYTANNSLLESAACGCNILIASDNADNSYIPEELLNIVPMNLEAVMGKLEQMKDSPTYNLSISKFIDEHYSWEVVGKTVQKFLSQL
jgi:glycosyltransferase involved in cell wall biosynthesis